MHRASRVLAALVIASGSTGCYHYSATLPGVLDTRSDGATAEASPPELSDEELQRTGASAWLDGSGVQADGAQVVIEERHFFAGITALLPGVFVLSNPSAEPELEAALGDAALRELRVGHQQSALDVFLSLGVNLIPCVPLFVPLQAFTFVAQGERVATGGPSPLERPVAPPMEPDPPPSSSSVDVPDEEPAPEEALKEPDALEDTSAPELEPTSEPEPESALEGETP